MRKILVAEDEQNLREGIATAFRDRGWLVTEACDGTQAIDRLEQEVFDVVVTDYKMPERSGLEVLKRCKMVSEGSVALIMTAYGTVESAVEAMKAGAYDYLLKPFDLEELEMKVERALEHRRLLARLQVYDRESIIPRFENIIGESPQMKDVFKTIEKVARSNATVLILGETGVGKELVAEALHRNSSRGDRPFVKMNCAALHENLLESELFGHEKGAFTGADRQRTGRFELANDGTLFLDEIGNMAPSTQAKVLRVLQEREFERLGGSRTIKVDVRLVAATNKNLEEAIGRGEFREDLYYRLNVVTIRVPPLRERKEDLVPLAAFFIDRFAAELKKDVRGLDPGAVRALKRHTWPGNIRELENMIERAVLMAEGHYVTADELNVVAGAGAGTASPEGAASMNFRLPPNGVNLEDLEKQAILEALRINNWVQKDAARFLGISSRVMNYKVAKYEIKSPRWSKNKLVG
jgi:Nif-specific regulatory protein